mmetsp:Transcript_6227/g.10677  ORF Transcript_6227/g.10677 Transcript_6227/m.10677 type:complete len:274 (-) Transcript_6227:3858-4679(-)
MHKCQMMFETFIIAFDKDCVAIGHPPVFKLQERRTKRRKHAQRFFRRVFGIVGRQRAVKREQERWRSAAHIQLDGTPHCGRRIRADGREKVDWTRRRRCTATEALASAVRERHAAQVGVQRTARRRALLPLLIVLARRRLLTAARFGGRVEHAATRTIGRTVGTRTLARGALVAARHFDRHAALALARTRLDARLVRIGRTVDARASSLLRVVLARSGRRCLAATHHRAVQRLGFHARCAGTRTSGTRTLASLFIISTNFFANIDSFVALCVG